MGGAPSQGLNVLLQLLHLVHVLPICHTVRSSSHGSVHIAINPPSRTWSWSHVGRGHWSPTRLTWTRVHLTSRRAACVHRCRGRSLAWSHPSTCPRDIGWWAPWPHHTRGTPRPHCHRAPM